MKDLDNDMYEYAKRDIGTSIPCPQCRAEEVRAGWLNEPNCSTKTAWRFAALEILRFPHKCGKLRYEGDVGGIACTNGEIASYWGKAQNKQ